MVDRLRALLVRIFPWYDPEGERRRARRTRELVNRADTLVAIIHDHYAADDARMRR